MNPTPDRTLDPQQLIAELQRQLAESNAERDEAQDQTDRNRRNPWRSSIPLLAILRRCLTRYSKRLSSLCDIAFGSLLRFMRPVNFVLFPCEPLREDLEQLLPATNGVQDQGRHIRV